MRILLFVLLAALVASCGKSDTASEVSETEAVAENLPTQTIKIRSDVYDTPQAAEPLAVGTHVPAVTVNRVSGEEINLAAAINEGATLVFYRGGW